MGQGSTADAGAGADLCNWRESRPTITAGENWFDLIMAQPFQMVEPPQI
jgi:hypothetical protein